MVAFHWPGLHDVQFQEYSSNDHSDLKEYHQTIKLILSAMYTNYHGNPK